MLRVPTAGPSRRSILSDTPACSQYSRAIVVQVSLMSQATTMPSAGNARAAFSALYPVNTPSSSVFLAPINRSKKRMNWPWTAPICIPACGKLLVLSRNWRKTSGSRNETCSMYSYSVSVTLIVSRVIFSHPFGHRKTPAQSRSKKGSHLVPSPTAYLPGALYEVGMRCRYCLQLLNRGT